MDAAAYKAAKEAFVTGHDGTSVAEVQWIVTVGIVSAPRPAPARTAVRAGWRA